MASHPRAKIVGSSYTPFPGSEIVLDPHSLLAVFSSGRYFDGRWEITAIDTTAYRQWMSFKCGVSPAPSRSSVKIENEEEMEGRRVMIKKKKKKKKKRNESRPI